MKKGKTISMPSTPEAQIRSRARNLPVYKCYVNPNWEVSQMATVVVIRKHTNDNITYACYLVDLMLLGVKDCAYEFNVTMSRLEDQLLSQPEEQLIECKYVLAHNIVYSAVAFAEDYGFAPGPAFTKTGQYVLEEDTDDFPVMDIPLGNNNIPVVWITPENSMQREIAILEKTAGAGNYQKIWVDDDGIILDKDFDFDDEEDDDDEYEETYMNLMEEAVSSGIDAYIKETKDNPSSLRMLVLGDILYHSRFNEQELEVIIKRKEAIMEDERFDPDMDRLPAMDIFAEKMDSIIEEVGDDKDAFMEKMSLLVDQYAEVPELSILLFETSLAAGKTSDAKKIATECYKQANDHYAVRLMYAQHLIQQKKYKSALELFGNKPGLDALTTENLPFTMKMVADFCACYVLLWLSKDNIMEAEPYYEIVVTSDYWSVFAIQAIEAMSKRKQAIVYKELKKMSSK